jgi:hypothetical protein
MIISLLIIGPPKQITIILLLVTCPPFPPKKESINSLLVTVPK